MPRYDKIVLRQILTDCNCRTIDDNGRVLPPSHVVYTKISSMMVDKGSTITPKHVHTIINNNRGGFRDLIMEVFGIRQREISFSVEDSNYSVERCAEQTSDDNTLTSLTSMRVNLVISPEKWKSMKPQEKIYGKRIYWKLRRGWTDVLAEALWMQHHLECVFVFKNHNIYRRATCKFFFKIEGSCSECQARFQCTLLKEPTKGVDVIFQCNIEGIRPDSHSGQKRRQLKGARRIEVADYLIDGGKDAVTWRRKEAGRIKKFGGKNPPILPSNKVIRKVKEQKYWLPEQLQICVSRCQSDPNATLAIDATGGIVKRDKIQKPHIFLYQCVLVTKDGSVPTFQMVSADQRSIIVAGFFSHILAANAPIPQNVVTDFGWSLLIAVARIFNQCTSFNDFLQRFYDTVVNKSSSLPSTFISRLHCHQHF